MGRFVNPDNSAFGVALNSEIYVDKTDLIEYTNSVLGTKQGYICNSRPRRFGKSITADMLTAYYSKGCDSQEMFSRYSIGKKKGFREHLNKYDVIHIDIQWFLSNVSNVDEIVPYINKCVVGELVCIYPDVLTSSVESISDALSIIKEKTGHKFIVIFDEWDVIIRDEAMNKNVQEEYINFLRGMFKGTEPTKYIQLAYLTGILPIKKIKTESALNNFEEFTMVNAKAFARYIGFTDDEVKTLCKQYNRDYTQVKRWYDGYLLGEYEVYNPKAVIEVIRWNQFQSYWSETGTYEAIVPLINMDFDGLKTDIIKMISGASIEVNTKTFQNDVVNFKNKDDVLTYLIHLGYLGYNPVNKTAFVPNEEIRQELNAATNSTKWNEFIGLQQASMDLLDSTLDMECDEVGMAIEKIHSEYVSSIQYNNENSLSSVITIAYLAAMQYYFKPIREFPTGRGFADFIFIPRPEYVNEYPALVVELKWNKSAQTAIDQIKERKYVSSICSYTGEILLVGISYDKKTKKHQCLIEKLDKGIEDGCWI
jgi:hypothetical protein